MRYVFGDYVFNTETVELRQAGRLVPLEPQVYSLLAYLVKHHGRVVSRQELLDQLWTDQHVVDAALSRCVMAARQALGDNGREQRMIQTVLRRGYRFIAPLEEPVPTVVPTMGEGDAETQTSLPSSATVANAIPLFHDDQTLIAERKIVTVLCGEWATSAAWTWERDLDRLHTQWKRIETQIRHLLHPYDATLLQCTREQLSVVFGAPYAQEDHAQRALLAAIDLQRMYGEEPAERYRSSEVGLALCTGLATGEVVVELRRDEQAEPLLIIGEVSRMATAMSQEASPGDLLISESTAREVQALAVLTPHAPVTVDEVMSVTTYRVVRARDRTFPHRLDQGRVRSRFVGRHDNLNALLQRLERAQAGQGQIVGIMGEPGLGKSRLLAEFRRAAADAEIHYITARCHSYGRVTPYLPVLDVIRQCCDLSPALDADIHAMQVRDTLQQLDMNPEHTSLISNFLRMIPEAATRPDFDLTGLKRQTDEQLWQLLLQQSRQRPCVVEIEDIHWIDQTSDEWFSVLAQRMAATSLLLAFSYRPGYRPDWLSLSYATQLSLSPLLATDSRRLIRTVLAPHSHAVETEDQVLAQAGGNPFFLEELAQSVNEQETITSPLSTPNTIQSVLAARIDRLPTLAKSLLQMAAVAGHEISVSLLQSVCGLTEAELQDQLQALRARELFIDTQLTPEPMVAFKHVLIREVAYRSMLSQTRRRTHIRIAQALITQLPELATAQPELVARHYTKAEQLAEAITYWQRAAELAVQRSAFFEAESHYQAALDCLANLPRTALRTEQEIALLIHLARTHVATKGWTAPQVMDAYGRAEALCRQIGDARQHFPALGGLWLYHLERGEMHTSKVLAQHLRLRARDANEPVWLLGAHSALGHTAFFSGEFAAAQAHLSNGLALYDRTANYTHLPLYGQGNPGLDCQLYHARALLLRGYPDQALSRHREALAEARALGQPYILSQCYIFGGFLYVTLQDSFNVQAQSEAAIALSQDHHFAQWLAMGRTLHGWALVRQGQTDRGIAQLRLGVQGWRTLGAQLSLPLVLGLLAEALGTIEQPDVGLTVVQEALDLIEVGGATNRLAHLLRVRGELRLAIAPHRVTEAEADFQRARGVARQQQAKWLELQAVLRHCHLLRDQGQPRVAQALLTGIYREINEGFETLDMQDAHSLLEPHLPLCP